MIYNILISLTLVLVYSNTIQSSPLHYASKIDESTYFMNHVELRGSNQYHLYWNYTDTDVTFKAVVKTTGWLGFGLSPNGGMYSSDVILAWFSPDGTENLVDAHVRPSGLHRPIVDTYQNWQKIFMKQENEYLTVIFKRKLTICGQANTGEVNLEVSQTQPIIFAYGDDFEDDQRTFPTYHGAENRGSKVLPILGSLNENVPLDTNNLEHADFTVDTVLPEGIVTEYYCQMFKIPDSWREKKRHIIRYDTITTPENLKYVHHWLMYECSESFETSYLKNHPFPEPATCLNANNHWGPVQGHCQKISLAWATGGDLEVTIPEEFGYPIGGSEKEFKYFFIQMHYENPGLVKNVHDKSGFRMYVTEDYRPTEFGVLTIGAQTEPLALLVPPKMQNLRFDNICRREFLNPMIQEVGDLHVFAELPHTHLAGTQMFTKLVRNDKEIEYISDNPYYDSEFQYVNFKQKHITIKPDDEIRTTCIYNTMDRNEFTLGGLGTYDEMCLNFLWYYPRNKNFDQCLESTQEDSWGTFLSSLQDKGDFNWVVNSEETTVEDTVESLMNSDKLMNNPAYMEEQFQNFYSNSNKWQHAVTNYGDYRVGFDHKEIQEIVKNDNC